MFDSYELPPPEAVASLDDIGLLDTMEIATALEVVAVDVQVAVMRELYRRRARPAPGVRPTPARPRAITSSPRSSRRRRRKARKRRRRR